MGDKLKVNFDTVLLDLRGKPILERVGVDELIKAFSRAGVAQENLDRALMAVQRFLGERPPEAQPLTAANVVLLFLQSAETTHTGADRKDRTTLCFKALDPHQPVEVSHKERDIILRAMEKSSGPEMSVWYHRMDELLNATPTEKPKLAAVSDE